MADSDLTSRDARPGTWPSRRTRTQYMIAVKPRRRTSTSSAGTCSASSYKAPRAVATRADFCPNCFDAAVTGVTKLDSARVVRLRLHGSADQKIFEANTKACRAVDGETLFSLRLTTIEPPGFYSCSSSTAPISRTACESGPGFVGADSAAALGADMFRATLISRRDGRRQRHHHTWRPKRTTLDQDFESRNLIVPDGTHGTQSIRRSARG